MNFIKKILNIFKGEPEAFSMGALVSPVDPRNIPASSFIPEATMPESFDLEDVGEVTNQGNKPKCTGASTRLSFNRIYKKNGIDFDMSDDDAYESAKKIDGIPDMDGTYPTVMAKVLTKVGVCSSRTYHNGSTSEKEAERAIYRLKGYAFVSSDFRAICNAIFAGNIVHASLETDSSWWYGNLSKVIKALGRHYISFTGFTFSEEILRGQNSWGISWIGYIAGIFNPKIKAGCFEIKWEDIKDSAIDLIIFADVPDELLKKTEKLEYRFTETMKFGSSGFEVIKLQERLISELYLTGKADGKFGRNTQTAVTLFQKTHNVYQDGICGAMTRAILNKRAIDVIPVFAKAIQAHEGYFKGSRSFRNNSPANFKTGGTLTPYMTKLGGVSLDAQHFVVFPTYEVGFNALCVFLRDACLGKLSSYQPTMTLYEFFQKYAPSSDNNDPKNYAVQVAKKVGCSIDTKLSEML